MASAALSKNNKICVPALFEANTLYLVCLFHTKIARYSNFLESSLVVTLTLLTTLTVLSSQLNQQEIK